MILWRQLLRIVLAIFLLDFGMSVGAESHQGSESAPAEHSIGKHIAAEGIRNFGEVTPQLIVEGSRLPRVLKRWLQWVGGLWWILAVPSVTNSRRGN
jgi:hypothetical protein